MRRRRATVLGLLGVLAVMVGLTAASVPLYRLFCDATGYGGATRTAAAAPAVISDRLVTVRFDAVAAPGLGWEFRPLTPAVVVHPGEEQVVAYRVTNRTDHPVTGTATHNVTPLKVGAYFDKLQCFCFTKQHLAPGESADLAVSFFVDPDIAADPNTRDVDTITLTYTMFRAEDDAPARAPALSASAQ